MPLKQSPSKKAFSSNVETEMAHGKPQDQALAISYSIKRKNKRKKMAEGGMAYKNDSAKTESRPMPSETDNDSEMVSQNSGNKPSKNDSWTDRSTVAQAQRPSRTPLSRPALRGSDAFSVRYRDEIEEDLHRMDSMSPESDKAQPPTRDNEVGPNRQGPKVSDMEDEHSTHRKPYAKGGQIEASDERHPLDGMYEDDLLDLGPSEDEGSGMARSHNEADADSHNPNALDMEREHSNGRKPYADGGEITEDHEDSLTAAIMARRDREHGQDSDSDEDRMTMMALGGEILEDSEDIHSHGSMDTHESSDQVDLSRNADEDANEEDQSSFNALRKENYNESEGLKQMTSPTDSNRHGHELTDEDEHDMVSAIRSRMNRQRQFRAK